MAIEREPGGNELGEVTGAAIDFEDPFTAAAEEVVMVPFARQFKPGRIAGNLNGNNDARLDEQFEGAIDGGDAQAGDAGLRVFENFLGGKGCTRIGNGIPDRLSLASLSFLQTGVLGRHQPG